MTNYQKQLVPTEHQEARTLVDWLSMKGLKFSKIAQDTWTPSFTQRMRQKIEGIHKGIPDYLVVLPPHKDCAMSNLLFIELKRTKRGIVSPEQKEWIETLNNCLGVEARICKGADEAIEFIEQFL